MYTLESNGNFTLVINDINLVIMPNTKYQLSKTDFDNSSDIKRLDSYLKITKNEDLETISNDESQHNEEKEKSTIFIAHNDKDEKVLENVFVKTLDETVGSEELVDTQLSNELENTESINTDDQTENLVEDTKINEVEINEELINAEETVDSIKNENINDLEIKEESVENVKKENKTKSTESSMKNNKKTKSKEDKLKEDKSKEITPQKKKGRPKTNNK